MANSTVSKFARVRADGRAPLHGAVDRLADSLWEDPPTQSSASASDAHRDAVPDRSNRLSLLLHHAEILSCCDGWSTRVGLMLCEIVFAKTIGHLAA